MLIKSPWCCGNSITVGGVAIGFTNIVALVLGILLYFNQLSEFSITIIVLSFLFFVLILTNALLIYGSVNSKPNFLLPWLTLYVLGTLALVVVIGVMWSKISQYKAVSLGVLLFNFYFVSVVIHLFHHLRHEKRKEEEATDLKEDAVGTERQDGTLLLDIEHTDCPQPLLLATDSAQVGNSSDGLPAPEEIINVPTSVLNSTNPFRDDVFDANKEKSKEEMKSMVLDINPDFTPFKKLSSDCAAPKMKVFLPKIGDGDSDIDFSFDDSRADFSFGDSTNMCKLEEDEEIEK